MINKELGIDYQYQNFIQWSHKLEARKARINQPKQQGKKPLYIENTQTTAYQIYKDRPIDFAQHVLGVKLHEGQKKFFLSSLKNNKNILVPSNQWGKTFLIAIKHIYLCYYKIGVPDEVQDKVIYETLNLSPKLRQVRAFYGYILQILQDQVWWKENGKLVTNECKIKDFLVAPKQPPNTNQLSQIPIKFSNGSKISAASTGGDLGGGLAGGQFPYISYDECPLSHNLREELGARIMSRLIKFNGSLDLIGTPDCLSDSFIYYQQLVDQGIKQKNGWKTQIGKLDDNIFISKLNRDGIKRSLKQTDPEKYRQVVYGEFVKGGSLLFRPNVIKNMWSEELSKTQYEPGKWISKEPGINRSYVLGVDWAMAGDYTVMIMMDYTDDVWEIVAWNYYRGGDRTPQEQYIDFLTLKNKYNAEAILDTNGLGGKLIESEFKDEPGMHGFNFGPGRKAGFIGTLKKALTWNSEGRVKCAYWKEMEEELGGYKIDDIKIRQDIVMALGLCTYHVDKDEELPDAVTYGF